MGYNPSLLKRSNDLIHISTEDLTSHKLQSSELRFLPFSDRKFFMTAKYYAVYLIVFLAN